VGPVFLQPNPFALLRPSPSSEYRHTVLRLRLPMLIQHRYSLPNVRAHALFLLFARRSFYFAWFLSLSCDFGSRPSDPQPSTAHIRRAGEHVTLCRSPQKYHNKKLFNKSLSVSTRRRGGGGGGGPVPRRQGKVNAREGGPN
jgi:hypothetical protein